MPNNRNIPIPLDEEWGNIELPGLSDEKLYSTNWNLSQAEREKWQDPVYSAKMRKKRQETYKDPEYRKKYLAAMQNLYNDENYRLKYLKGMEKLKNCEQWKLNQKLASDKFRNDPEWKAKKRKEMLENLNNPEYQRKRKEGLRAAYKNPALREKLKNLRVHQKKKIKTPDGIFESRKAAAEFYGIDPTQINHRIKKHPEKYFYIKE